MEKFYHSIDKSTKSNEPKKRNSAEDVIPLIKVEPIDDEDDVENMEMSDQLTPIEGRGGQKRKSNLLFSFNRNRRTSLPALPSYGAELLSVETERRKSSLPPNLEKYTSAARRIHRTISTVTGKRKLTTTQALHFMLEEVNKNENLNAEELIKKLQDKETKCDIIYEEPLEEIDIDESITILEEQINETDECVEEQFGGSILAKIAQYLAFGSMDLEDFGKLSEETALKNKLDTSLDYILTKLQEEWGYCIEILVPVKQIHTMIFIGFFQLLTASQVLKRIPTFVAYLSFFFMIYSTLKIFRNRQSMKNFLTWKRLLSIFAKSDSLKDKNRRTESVGDISFNSWPSSGPFLIFVVFTVIFIFSFSLSFKFLPNILPMSLMAAIFSILCFILLPDRFDKTTVFVYFLDFIICVSQLNIYSNNFLFQTLTTINLKWSTVHLSLQSVCFMVLLSILAWNILVTKTYKRSYCLQFVLSHIVCLLWLQITVTLVKSSNFAQIGVFNVALTCGLVWLTLFPVTGVLAIVICIVLSQHVEISINLLIKLFVTLSLFCAPFLIEKLSAFANFSNYFKIRKNVALVFCYIILVIASTAAIYQGSTNLSAEATTSLSWTDFENHCGGGTQNFNRLKRQLLCTELKGTVVSWTGKIDSIQIVKIENFLEYIFTICPNFLADFLRCFYGQFVKDSPEVSQLTGRSCSTADHNVYTFTVEIIGPWNSETKSEEKLSRVVLIASDIFKEILFQLVEGDVISFAAMFEDYYLSYSNPLQLRLLSITCVHCKNVDDSEHDLKPEIEYVGFWSNVIQAFQHVFNFLFFPLFSIE